MRTFSAMALGVFFVAAGIMHFVRPDFYLKMMPPWIPWHHAAVYGSGVAEILLGIGVLVPQTRAWAARGLILLLIAVFPANIYVALNPGQFPEAAPWMWWLRLPFQGVFIGWAWWHRT